ncbi:MAG TPA: SDR family NAD(P)-dependent oxidoreductase, partial [Anaerolineae bacterium]|nr:SDR family NAD(P)-dependent oxidoreductase [Anaerolineae bacterium]
MAAWKISRPCSTATTNCAAGPPMACPPPPPCAVWDWSNKEWIMEIAGKTALVTGGAQRVGRAITLALAGAGANVVINYHRSAAPAQETAAEARALGVGALPVQADVADHEQVAALVAAARERFGAVDILVNGASLWQKTPFPTA